MTDAELVARLRAMAAEVPAEYDALLAEVIRRLESEHG